ncbi:calcyclin-binding protein-like [Acanthaster planci]|uniref:Calcyclin-binding protein n=1 Tax=Acanthaster planci TaxID=133434 RepID=A0A8B7XWV3_ACAPL|nr:calcyclin-binding protein-like [Acanthaster planci]
MAGVTHIEQLKLDLEEVNKLIHLADRQRVKGVLSIEKGRLEAEIAQKEKASSMGGGGETARATPAGQKQKQLATTTIKTYGWDQSDKFVKIYITLNGVHSIPAENVSVEYGENSFKLVANNLRDANHQLAINGLLRAILPKESHFKIKTDDVVIFLKKRDQGNSWKYLTQVEQRLKDKDSTPEMDKDADPSSGIMDLMKKMYDEGDDEMKRTIAKAWTESRDKQGAGMM